MRRTMSSIGYYKRYSVVLTKKEFGSKKPTRTKFAWKNALQNFWKKLSGRKRNIKVQ